MENTTEIIPAGLEHLQELAQRFRAAQEQSQQLIEGSLRVAWDLGAALAQVELEFEQPEFEAILGGLNLEKVVARKLVKYSRTTSRDRLMDSGQAMLALGFAPDKRANAPDTGTVKMLPHLSAAVAAWSRYVRAIATKQLELDVEEARRETAEMFAWLTTLHKGGANG